MFRVLADHVYNALALDNLALWTKPLNRRFHFHGHYPSLHNALTTLTDFLPSHVEEDLNLDLVAQQSTAAVLPRRAA
jgi:hypothetical protein